MAAAAILLFDQLADLGDPLPAGVPRDEAGFCSLVQGAGSVDNDDDSSAAAAGPLQTLARELVRRVRAVEAAANGGDGAAAMDAEVASGLV